MKCIMRCEKNGPRTIVRVSNEQAAEAVKNDGWKYCPKSMWKAEGRP